MVKPNKNDPVSKALKELVDKVTGDADLSALEDCPLLDDIDIDLDLDNVLDELEQRVDDFMKTWE